jgi:hypothetical protein
MGQKFYVLDVDTGVICLFSAEEHSKYLELIEKIVKEQELTYHQASYMAWWNVAMERSYHKQEEHMSVCSTSSLIRFVKKNMEAEFVEDNPFLKEKESNNTI